MKFSLFMFFFFLLSCGNINIPADLNNNKKDSNIKMKVTGKPNIKQKK
tara:strand:- start:289 stop:432 length:144 start_codon:yes stop_codon:yes gene_type:complete